jgi:hypothetical protein
MKPRLCKKRLGWPGKADWDEIQEMVRLKLEWQAERPTIRRWME